VFFFAVFNVKAFAADYSVNTSDPLINHAISLTESINNNSVVNVLQGDNSTRRPITVQFANLSTISINYINADVVTIIDENDRMHIYIDKALKNSPPEAIACILEHETTHNDAVSSVAEEVVAWTKEATSWIYFTQKNPLLVKLNESQYPLVKRLNYIVGLYKSSGNSSIAIREEILANQVYTKLALHSSGY
jgi:hypothetical protein